MASATGTPSFVFYQGPYQSGSGGEFQVIVNEPGAEGLPEGTILQTFCLERNEYISFGQTYYFKINTYTDKGGVGGGSNDPIDPMTAWLYNEFLKGTLEGYDFEDDDIGRKTSARSLQNAIWYLEQELDTLSNNTLAESFVQMAQASSWVQTGIIGNTRAFNVFQDETHTLYAQDLLCRIVSSQSTYGPTVPVPKAFLLTGFGVICIGSTQRHNRQ